MTYTMIVNESDTSKVTKGTTAVLSILKAKESMPKIIVTSGDGAHTLTVKVKDTKESEIVMLLSQQKLMVVKDNVPVTVTATELVDAELLGVEPEDIISAMEVEAVIEASVDFVLDDSMGDEAQDEADPETDPEMAGDRNEQS
jgi:hypothetical protein